MTALALDARFTVTAGTPPTSFSVEVELRHASGILVLFGPSGSGKTLTLQTLAGLLRPSQGHIRVGGEAVFDGEGRVDVPTDRRRVGYVPQHQSLFPFLDVAGNVVFGLPRAQRKPASAATLALLEELGIAHRARASPSSLSGGERQRVALARALASSPRLLLLDEPFAAIDREGRLELREILRATLRRRSVPAVFVTHDLDEARGLGDTLVRFEHGRTAGVGALEPPALRDASVTVRGTASNPTLLEGGRGRVTLESATLEGPLELLEPSSPGPLAIVLRAPPRASRS